MLLKCDNIILHIISRVSRIPHISLKYLTLIQTIHRSRVANVHNSKNCQKDVMYVILVNFFQILHILHF